MSSAPATSYEMTVMGIETSCDETGISIVSGRYDRPGGKLMAVNIRSHLVETQTALHIPFGGVVPEVAARDHLAKILVTAREALSVAKLDASQLDAVAVTLGPGLIGALMVGVLFAQGLATSLKKPLLGVNHVNAHMTPAFLLADFQPNIHCQTWLPAPHTAFPALALTASGGHCHLDLYEDQHTKKLLGQSLDDACGEAFDKVGKLLGLPYPGGPAIEELARGGSARYALPIKIANPQYRYDFSYSGLKTAVMDIVRKETGTFTGKIDGSLLPEDTKRHIAYSFQEAALQQLWNRVQNALDDHPQVQTILVAGGVAQNKRFRELFSQTNKFVRFAPPALCSDNGTMIALRALAKPDFDGFATHPFSRYV